MAQIFNNIVDPGKKYSISFDGSQLGSGYIIIV